MVYNVRFGSFWKNDQFNMTGNGTVELTDDSVILAGTRFWSFVRIILVFVLYEIFKYLLKFGLSIDFESFILTMAVDLGLFLLAVFIIHSFSKKKGSVSIEVTRLRDVKRSGNFITLKTKMDDIPNSY